MLISPPKMWPNTGGSSDLGRSYFKAPCNTDSIPQGPYRYLFPEPVEEAYYQCLENQNSGSLLAFLDVLESYIRVNPLANFLFLSLPDKVGLFGQLIEEEIAIPIGFSEKRYMTRRILEVEHPIEAEDRIAKYKTPNFSLDSIYGTSGEAYLRVSHLYQEDDPFLFNLTPPQAIIAMESVLRGEYTPPGVRKNGPSTCCQAFRKAHNKLMLIMRELGVAEDKWLFRVVRQELTRMFQWLLLNEFLPAIVAPSLWERVLLKTWEESVLGDRMKGQFMPMEVAVMAFVAGNKCLRKAPPNVHLDIQIGKKADSMSRYKGVPFCSQNAGMHLAGSFLRWGYRLSVPTGQNIIQALQANGCQGIMLLDEHEILRDLSIDHRIQMREHGLVSNTPLWFYLQREAAVQEGGERFGQLGSWMLGHSFRWMLAHAPLSVIRNHWEPQDSHIPALREIRTIDTLLDWVERE